MKFQSGRRDLNSGPLVSAKLFHEPAHGCRWLHPSQDVLQRPVVKCALRRQACTSRRTRTDAAEGLGGKSRRAWFNLRRPRPLGCRA